MILAGAICNTLRPDPLTKRMSRMLTVFYLVQLGVGAVNVILLAPVWLQMAHLLLSDLVWITLVLLTSSVLAEPALVESWDVALTKDDEEKERSKVPPPAVEKPA